MTVTELLLLAATFVAICAAVYWHRRWSNATKAEDSAARRIHKLEAIMYQAGLRKENGNWVIPSRWGHQGGRKGPL